MRVSLSARSTEPLLAAELPQAFRLRLRPGRCLCPLGRSPFRAPSQTGDDEDRKGRAGECEGPVHRELTPRVAGEEDEPPERGHHAEGD
jgi:hypothetical protein